MRVEMLVGARKQVASDLAGQEQADGFPPTDARHAGDEGSEFVLPVRYPADRSVRGDGAVGEWQLSP